MPSNLSSLFSCLFFSWFLCFSLSLFCHVFPFLFICWSSNCITLIDLLNWLIHKTAPPGNNLKMFAHIIVAMPECCSTWSSHWFGSALHHFCKLFFSFPDTSRAAGNECLFILYIYIIYSHTSAHVVHIRYKSGAGFSVCVNFSCNQISWGFLSWEGGVICILRSMAILFPRWLYRKSLLVDRI